MKFTSTILCLAAVAHSASAHYIFNTLVAGDQVSATAVRKPKDNMPIKPVTSSGMTCNVDPFPATSTLTVAAGSTITFKADGPMYHAGPAAIYLGQAPGSAASWDGSGANWFKIAEWGATFNPFAFVVQNSAELTTTIPENTPAGEYLVRVEQLGMHITPPESFVSCAQIKITGSGSGNPGPKVSIPGYIQESDANVNVNIYYPVPTSYTVPGPSVWRG
ncbi:Endo-beta-1,4-glucanase D [Hypsizygus marmoreus]|uniref:AA9 family lytic polysaccharide monooxygenase n=1 Tax=Hypsizygus marmoreus TaxID=39966 RepID=A0A369J3T4_HYPMA|nr:Endo-beta-1,4-glucanase D [Hypsizygus marmoreus]